MSRIFESMTMLGMLGGSGGGSGGSQNCLSLQTRKAAMPERDYPAWRTVVYGNDKFVAFPQAQSIPAYSGDGIYWQDAEIPDDLTINMGWNSVVYGQGKFVAVAGNTDKAAYSSDGINWTETTMPCSAAWYSVAYGNGRFVAISYGGGEAAYSEDGINWVESTMPSAYRWSSVTYAMGKFVAVTNDAGVVAYSEDGSSWTETEMTAGGGLFSVTGSSNRFVAVGIDNNRAACSDDGISWTETTMPAVRKWRSVAYGNGRFVAVAEGTDKAAFSMDGITWTETNMPGISEWCCVAYGKGRFIAVDFDGPVPALSEDGITWVTEVDAIMQGGQDVTQQVSQAQGTQGVIISGPAQPGQLLLVESVSEDGKLLKCTAVDRTHYETDPVISEILPETTVDLSSGEAVLPLLNLVAGEVYTVFWNGTEYACAAESVAMEGITAVFIGNAAAIGGEDNGIPFVIGDIPAQGAAMCMAMDGSTSATVRVTGAIPGFVKKLDNKFIDAEWMATKTVETKEFLPETAVSNNATVPGLTPDMFTVGTNMVVTVDGVAYNTVVRRIAECVYIGNWSIAGGDIDTGEPFLIGQSFADNAIMVLILKDGDACTLAITGEVFTYNQLPSEYVNRVYTMPTDLATKVDGVELYEAKMALLAGNSVFAAYDGDKVRVLFAASDDSYDYLWIVSHGSLMKYSTVGGWMRAQMVEI